MEKIEIGAGFTMTALSFFNIFQNKYAVIVLLIIGISLIFHGFYELYFKPKIFLKCFLKKWFSSRHWDILSGINPREYPEYIFVLAVEDKQHHRVAISKSKENSSVLVFHSTIPRDGDRAKLSLSTPKQQEQLIEDIRLFLASKDMPFEGIRWPLEKVLVERVLPIGSNISEQIVDDTAKQVVFAIVGINTLIRKSLTSSIPDNKGL